MLLVCCAAGDVCKAALMLGGRIMPKSTLYAVTTEIIGYITNCDLLYCSLEMVQC